MSLCSLEHFAGASRSRASVAVGSRVLLAHPRAGMFHAVRDGCAVASVLVGPSVYVSEPPAWIECALEPVSRSERTGDRHPLTAGCHGG